MTLRRSMLAGATGAAVLLIPAVPAHALGPLTAAERTTEPVVELVRTHGKAVTKNVKLHRANARLRGSEAERGRRAELRDWTVPHVRRHNDRLERRNAALRREARKAAAARRAAATATPGHLQAIAQCESGGDPSAVSGDGTYRGKYQFDQQTWAAVGGSGDPAAAPEAEQDARAAQLYAQSGSSPWPVCGG